MKNRRHFIKTIFFHGIAIMTWPFFSFKNAQEKYSRAILIGKGKPIFYGKNYSLQKEAYQQFEQMKALALKSGFQIKVISSYRSYAHQNRIWERKYKRFTKEGLSPKAAIKKIIEYSTIPGTSRHHWGTDLDIVDGSVKQPESVLKAKHFHGNGPFCKFKEWLDLHAESFGFYEVYTNNAKRKGFKYEPWHFSYAPISIPMLKAYRQIDIKTMLQEEHLMGSEHFTDDFITSYLKDNILDINPNLL